MLARAKVSRKFALRNSVAQRPIIRGAGGGKSGDSHTPVEAPNTLQSTAYARAIDLISEGEIVGLVDGMKSIYFDDTRLQNDDGTFNFRGITLLTRNGLPSQDPIPGFPAVEDEVAVGTQVLNGSPIVRAITKAEATAARITLRIPSLQQVDTGTGDINPTSVAIKIEIQPSGGVYITAVNDTISGKTVSPYQRSYRIPLTGSAPWNIRVSRGTPNSISSALSNDTFWDSYTELQDYQLQYPNSAVIGVSVNAQVFGNKIPTRKYLIDGVKMSVPSNYDPLTRTYVGIWDGTFKTAWHSNPAWTLFGFIENTRWGLGEFVPAAFRDKWTLYTIGQYCDELVPDGFGGMEPRYTFNAVFATAEDALKVLQSIASVFRGMIYWGSAGVTATADRDRDPIKLVNQTNVVGGIVNWSGGGLKARHTVALVTWYDPSDLYQPNIEVVEGDPQDIERFGWRTLDVIAVGCVSRGQAHRMGLWQLETEAGESEAANWQAFFDHSDLYPGDIAEVADPAYAGIAFGGRVKSVPTTTSVQLDRPIMLELGKTYKIRTTLSDGTLAERNVTTGSGVTVDTLSLDLALSPAPIIGAVWVMTSSSVAPRRVKIVSRKENKGLYDINAILHDPTKYARIEQGIVLERTLYTALPLGPISAPIGLALTECLTLVGGGLVRSKVVLSWTASTDPRVLNYQVQVKPPDQNWQPASPEFAAGVSTDLFDLTEGTWGFRVRAIDAIGRCSPWLTLEAKALEGLLQNPDDITDVRSTYKDDRLVIDWVEISDYRQVRYEIRQGTTFEGSLRLGDVAHPPFTVYGDGTYWVAAYIGPDAGPRVYSVHPSEIIISGALLVGNIIVQHDEKAEGWPGFFTGGSGKDLPFIRTGGQGNVEAATDFLGVPDVLNAGGQGNGTYISRRVIDIGRPANCLVGVIFDGTGSPVGQSILSILDTLGTPDFLGALSAQFIDVYPIIRISQDGPGDVFGSGDVFAEDDAFYSNLTWGPWQRFSPGAYTGRLFQMGMALNTTDPLTIAYCLGFKWWVDVPDRSDHQTGLAIAPAGTAIVFRPDNAAIDAPFNGGPNASATPNIQITINNAQAGDLAVLTAKTLAGCTIQVLNAGVGVARSVDLLIRGY